MLSIKKALLSVFVLVLAGHANGDSKKVPPVQKSKRIAMLVKQNILNGTTKLTCGTGTHGQPT